MQYYSTLSIYCGQHALYVILSITRPEKHLNVLVQEKLAETHLHLITLNVKTTR